MRVINKKSPLVSVIIPTHNRRMMVYRLINSVLNNTYKNLEIIVIDDCSNDNTKYYLQKKFSTNKKIKIYRNNNNLYTAGSRNNGLERANGELVFFIDDDNDLDSNAIANLVYLFNIDRNLGEAGPVNYSLDNKRRILWAGTKRSMTTSFTYQLRSLKSVHRQKHWITDDVPNAFMVRRKILVENNIKFDKHYGIMYEESDFAYRIRRLGYSVKVVRDAKIYHDTENTSRGSRKKNYMHHFMNDIRRPYVFARNRIIFHYKYSNKLQLISILVIGIWGFTFYYIFKIFTYKGEGYYSLSKKLNLAYQYLKGNISGITYIFSRKH